MTFSDEKLVTQSTFEWTFTGMCAHMCLEVASLREFLEASDEGTHEKFHFILWSFYFLNARKIHVLNFL